MRALYPVLLVSMAATCAVAFNPGVYRAGKNRVVVKLNEPDATYHVNIQTQDNQFTCSFDENLGEVDEGDLRFRENACYVRVYQSDDSSLSVSTRGCEDYCGAGARMDIPRAKRL